MDMSIDRMLGLGGIGLGILGIFIGIGVAIAMDPKSKGELAFSIGCFVFSGLILSVTIGAWGVTTDASAGRRIFVSCCLFAVIGVSLIEASRWANGRYQKAGIGSEDTKIDSQRLAPPPPAMPPPEATAGPTTEVSKHPETPIEPLPVPRQAVPPLRRPIEVQADMLRSWIGQTVAETKVNEMWLSQLFLRLLDNIPGGPDVDVPAALRYLDSKGEVEILETSNRKYRTWWGETFQEDIRFKIKNSNSGSSPQEPTKDSKSARQEKSTQPKAKSPAGTEQQQSGKPDTQIGSITTGPCSNVQVGGTKNTAIGGDCVPPARKLTPSQIDSLASCLRPNPGKFAIGSVSGNSEAYRYAQYWYEVFSSAGWVNQQPIPIGSMLLYEPVPNGLEFMIHGDTDDISNNVALIKGSPEITLHECLNKARIVTKLIADKNRATGIIWITVGERPIEK